MLRRLSRRLSSASFQESAAAYWTSERVHWLTGGKPHALSPNQPGTATLLRALNLLDDKGALTAGGLRKFQQVNALLGTLERAIGAPLTQPSDRPLYLVDLCAGQGHVALMLAHAAQHRWSRPAHILAVDADRTRVGNARLRAQALGLDRSLRFRTARVAALGRMEEEYARAFGGAAPPPAELAPHAVLALHGCDTATDEAIAFGARAKSSLLLLAPCCQAELAAKWAAAAAVDEEDGGLPAAHPFGPIHRNGSLRREVASDITDALRISLLKAAGYSVTCKEFVGSEHTPKNRLLLARRMRTRDANAGRKEALAEYDSLRMATGGHAIALEDLLLRNNLLGPGYVANDWD
ncbi:hypothetical protein AB1Y20_015652 [Prymnesium parvum]|uniref:Methyltransferase domain-containing protein n=1 Tax=Prymnesium parvum TaxID=97485 RepID=A0AB34K127_PRYPA